MPSSFQHPAHIPIRHAMAVHAIMHESATPEDWTVVTTTERCQALAWFAEILRANGESEEKIDCELEWYEDHLAAHS